MRKLPVIAAAVALAAAAAPGAATAGAAEKKAKPKTTYYLALGDSLGAGIQQDEAGTPFLSKNRYVDQVYKRAKKRHKRLKLVNLSCPGESTTTFLKGGCPAPLSEAQKKSQYRAAVKFLKKNRKRTKLITLSLGGNEFTPCARGGNVDITCALNGLETLKRQLPEVARKLRKAAGRKVRIAAQTQYNPFLALYLKGGPYAELSLTSATLAQQVSLATRDAFVPSRIAIADVYRAFGSHDVETHVPFNGAHVPLGVAKICELTQMCLPAPQGNIHPNDAGYTLMAKEFIKALKL